MSTTWDNYDYCEHCGWWHQGPCPHIKAIEYHRNGTIKRVEYHENLPMEPVVKKYITINGQLRELVDDMPPGAIPFKMKSGL